MTVKHGHNFIPNLELAPACAFPSGQKRIISFRRDSDAPFSSPLFPLFHFDLVVLICLPIPSPLFFVLCFSYFPLSDTFHFPFLQSLEGSGLV